MTDPVAYRRVTPLRHLAPPFPDYWITVGRVTVGYVRADRTGSGHSVWTAILTLDPEHTPVGPCSTLDDLKHVVAELLAPHMEATRMDRLRDVYNESLASGDPETVDRAADALLDETGGRQVADWDVHRRTR